MISYGIYKLVHYSGIFLLIGSLGGIALHMACGGTRDNFPARRWTGMVHGIGLLLALVGGFGMYARLYGGAPLAPWVWMKILIWVLLGAVPAVLYRLRGASYMLFFVVTALAVTAGAMAFYKPLGVTMGASAESESVQSESMDAANQLNPDDDEVHAGQTTTETAHEDDPNMVAPSLDSTEAK